MPNLSHSTEDAAASGIRTSSSAADDPLSALQLGQKKSNRQAAPRPPKKLLLILLGVAVVLLVGFFVFRMLSSQSAANFDDVETPNLTTATSSDIVAQFTYNDETYDVAPKEVWASICAETRVAPTQERPGSTEVLSHIYLRVLELEALARGLSASEEEVESYMNENYAISSASELAASWSIDAEATAQEMTRKVLLSKLQKEITADELAAYSFAEDLEPPSAPGEDASDTNEVYGAYLVALLGNEWDASTETWARTDGIFYQSFYDETFSSSSASYYQAAAAYSIAQSIQTGTYNTPGWLSFTADILSKVGVSLYGLV